jgi:hypothetical protein
MKFSKWRQTWRKWTLINKIAAIAAIVTTPLGLVQGVQMAASGYKLAKEAIRGPEPLELPLRDIHKGMLEEVEYNLDCLKSYRTLGKSPPTYEMCKPKGRYIDTWFHHISALTTRDYYSDSTDLLRHWILIKEYQDGLSELRSIDEFNSFEEKSE